jgi:SLOG in TRPM, prokaryote
MASPLRSVESWPELEAELATFQSGRSVLLVGGADFASADPDVVDGIRSFLGSLAGACEDAGAAVVDGGTDAGVMRWFAEARDAIGGTFPLVGVAPRFAFERPTRTGRPITVAAGHSVVFAVPGEQFGDEMPWLFSVADDLGGVTPAPTVLVNGGDLAATEARRRLADGGVVLAVAGSGRAADELASELAAEYPGECDEGDLRASGRLQVIPLDADEAAIAAALEEAWTE